MKRQKKKKTQTHGDKQLRKTREALRLADRRGGGERERQTDRNRQRDRDRERQKDRERETERRNETERRTHRETERPGRGEWRNRQHNK